MSLKTFRTWSLALAETFDAWRVVPRAILVAYGWMVWEVTRWYMSIPSANQTSCQADVLQALIQSGTTLEQARSTACSIIQTVGGPTSEQTMFVSITAGLSSVVIGLYLNSGKSSKWQGGVVDAIAVPAPAPMVPQGYRLVPDTQDPGQPYMPPRGRWRQRPHQEMMAGDDAAGTEEEPMTDEEDPLQPAAPVDPEITDRG